MCQSSIYMNARTQGCIAQSITLTFFPIVHSGARFPQVSDVLSILLCAFVIDAKLKFVFEYCAMTEGVSMYYSRSKPNSKKERVAQ